VLPLFLQFLKLTMENDALRKILNRFKISDFNEICKRWPYLRNRKLDSILRLKRKIELVNRVLEIAKVIQRFINLFRDVVMMTYACHLELI